MGGEHPDTAVGDGGAGGDGPGPGAGGAVDAVLVGAAALEADPAVTEGAIGALGVVDLACGNSYLTFIVAESLRLSQTPAQILGVDVREDVIARSTQRASTMEFANIHFRQATIVEAEREITSTLRRAPDIVVALHACDTATDEALAFAISVDTPAILCVPCCHAQVAAQLQKSKSCELAALWQQGACDTAARHVHVARVRRQSRYQAGQVLENPRALAVRSRAPRQCG